MTMSPEQYAERGKQFEADLEELVLRYADVVGPAVCAVHGGDEECSPQSCPSESIDSFLSEWVLVMGWNTTASGDNVITDATPHRALLSHTIGLLRAAQVLGERDF